MSNGVGNSKICEIKYLFCLLTEIKYSRKKNFAKNNKKSKFFQQMKLIKFIVNSVVENTMKIVKKPAVVTEKPTVIAYPPSEDCSDSFLKPLSASFYSNLLRLEEKIQRRDFSENTINEIILLYAVNSFYYHS